MLTLERTTGIPRHGWKQFVGKMPVKSSPLTLPVLKSEQSSDLILEIALAHSNHHEKLKLMSPLGVDAVVLKKER